MWVVEQDSYLHLWGEDDISFATMSECLEGVLPGSWDAYSDDLDINLAQQVSCTTTARTCYAPTLRPDP